MDEEDWASGSASGGGNIAPVIERRREEKQVLMVGAPHQNHIVRAAKASVISLACDLPEQPAPTYGGLSCLCGN